MSTWFFLPSSFIERVSFLKSTAYLYGSVYSHFTRSGVLKASFPLVIISLDKKSKCLCCVKSLTMVLVVKACLFTRVFKLWASVADIFVCDCMVTVNRKKRKTRLRIGFYIK